MMKYRKVMYPPVINLTTLINGPYVLGSLMKPLNNIGLDGIETYTSIVPDNYITFHRGFSGGDCFSTVTPFFGSQLASINNLKYAIETVSSPRWR